jgi:hypothetical protein
MMQPEVDVSPKRRVPWVALLVIGFLLFATVSILGPIFASARVAATRSQVISNLKKLAVGWQVYASDYDEKGCPTANWNQLLLNHPKSGVLEEHLIDTTFKCLPTYDCVDNRALGLNKNLGGFNQNSDFDPNLLVLFAQSKEGGPNQLASKATLPEERMMIAFIDCHVRMKTFRNIGEVVWEVPVAKPVVKSR